MCVSSIKRDRVAVSYLLNNRPASMMIKNANNENVNEAITEAETTVVTAGPTAMIVTSTKFWILTQRDIYVPKCSVDSSFNLRLILDFFLEKIRFRSSSIYLFGFRRLLYSEQIL